MRSWIVGGRLGARRRGASPSHPSSTCSSANSGSTSCTGVSSASAPSSTSWSAATVVIAFVIEAMRNIVSGPTSGASGSPARRRPAAPS